MWTVPREPHLTCTPVLCGRSSDTLPTQSAAKCGEILPRLVTKPLLCPHQHHADGARATL